MKVLFDHHLPFALTHGGLEQQLVETKAALEKIGFEADYVRWWDAAQCGDIIHFIGRPTADYISFAHGRGCKVIIAELLTATGSRSSAQLSIQKKNYLRFKKNSAVNIHLEARMGFISSRRCMHRAYIVGSAFNELSF